MDVLFLDQSDRFGGAEKALLEIVSFQAKSTDLKVGVCSWMPKKWYQENLPDGVQYVCLNDSQKMWMPEHWGFRIPGLSRVSRKVYAQQLEKKLKKIRPKLVVFNCVFGFNEELVNKVKSLGHKIGFIVHALQWQVALSEQLLNKADVVLAVSNIVESELKSITCNADIRCRYIGVKAERREASPAVNNDVDNRVILVPGAVSMQKGQIRVLNFFAEKHQHYGAFKLVFVGGFDESDSENKAQFMQRYESLDSALKSKIVMEGFSDDLNEWYKNSDVVVSLSKPGESFGRIGIEAALNNKPCILSNLGASSEIVVHGETGYLVDPDDVTQIESCLDALFSDEGKRSRMGEKAYHYVKNKFDTYSCAEKITNDLKGIIL